MNDKGPGGLVIELKTLMDAVQASLKRAPAPGDKLAVVDAGQLWYQPGSSSGGSGDWVKIGDLPTR